jgi:hypothetical protein
MLERRSITHRSFYWIEVIDVTDYRITPPPLPPPTGWFMMPDNVPRSCRKRTKRTA